MRALGWVSMLVGWLLAVVAVFQLRVDVPPLLFGVALMALGIVLLVPDDLLGDHPADELEERRRRGAAGWQKPVAPPSPGSRPGGLPPARRRHGGEDPVQRRSK